MTLTRIEEALAITRLELGRRYTFDLILMNGESRRLEGVVQLVAFGRGTRTTLKYTGLSLGGDDANWYDPVRQHYRWVPVKE